MRVRKSREVSQHALEPHVAGDVRSLDLAGDVKCHRSIRKARNRYRRVHALRRRKQCRLCRPTWRRSGHRQSAPSRQVERSRMENTPNSSATATSSHANRSVRECRPAAAGRQSSTTAISTCSACCDPIQAISSRLAPSAPAMAPKRVGGIDAAPSDLRHLVFRRATARSAKGKLAPQSTVGGNRAQHARARSS